MLTSHEAARRAALPLAVIAASLGLAACGGQKSAEKPHATTTIAKKHKNKSILTKANMAMPLYPVNADYDHAGMASAYLDSFDYEDAQGEIAKINDPGVEAQARYLVEQVHAEIAADSMNSFDTQTARQELSAIHDPKLRKSVERIMDDYAFVVAADAALIGSLAEARTDANAIHSGSLKERLAEVIKAEGAGHDNKANALEQTIENRADNLTSSLSERADAHSDALWRHSSYYHKQYAKAPDH